MRYWKVNQAEYEAKMKEQHPQMSIEDIHANAWETSDGCYVLPYDGEANGAEWDKSSIRGKIDSGEIIRPDL